MRRVLIDTVGFLSLWNIRDQWHVQATTAFRELIAEGADFLTTTYILLECGNAVSRTVARSDVVQVRLQFLADGKLIDPTEEDCLKAWDIYARGQTGGAGIVDCVSFEVMRRLGITEAFTNDKHFRIAGFTTLF